MYMRIGYFLIAAVFCLLVSGMKWDGGEAARAAVISVTPANVKAAADRANADRAEGVAEVKTIQQILAADATYVGDEDILNFAPGEYEDAGELLITRAITLRKDPDADGKVVFKGKVLINIKTDDVTVQGLEFMDVTVPDAVTMTVDRDRNTAGDQPLVYGFPGKTIKEMLDEDGFDVDDQELAQPYLNPKLGGTNSHYDWVNLPFVTVVDPDSTTNNGRVANRLTGAPIAGARTPGTENASPQYAIQDSIVAVRAKGVLGVIWVDSSAPAVGASCKMSTADPPAELPQIKGVAITNNVFNGTETAGVRAGSMRSLLVRDGALRSCRVQLDIVGNTFSNIGGTGGFVKVRNEGSNLPDVTDANGNKIAEPGNVAPAISVTSPAGTGDAKTRILSNTITGGLGDGIELRWTPLGQKVDIKNNLLIDTPLDGITVIGSGFAATDTTTDISVMGNKIVGTSNNRYLTVYAFLPVVELSAVFYGRHFRSTVSRFSNDPSAYSFVKGSGNSGGCVGDAIPLGNSQDRVEARRALVERIKAELWRSPTPQSYTYAVKFRRGVKFLPAYSSEASDVFVTTGFRYPPFANFPIQRPNTDNNISGRSAVYRIAADKCYDLARIKVYDQAGVSITGNDLGYNPPETPEKRFDVIDYGIVIAGATTGMKLKALSGNNIDFATVNSIKNGGVSLSVAGNYFGPREPQFGGTGTVTGRDDASDSPLETMAGPRDEDINPDTAAPALTTSGDNAPMVDGTTLTLTFDENLDGDSVPAESAFRVVGASSTRSGSRTLYTVDDVGVAGMKVTLTLGETVDPGTTGLTVTYTKPASNALADASGNEIADFSNRVNVAGTPPPGPGPAAMPSSDDGGCALASSESEGACLAALLLAIFGFAVGSGGRNKKNAS